MNNKVIREFLSLFTERVSPSGSSNEIRNYPSRIRMSRESNRDQLPPGQPPPGPGKFEFEFPAFKGPIKVSLRDFQRSQGRVLVENVEN